MTNLTTIVTETEIAEIATYAETNPGSDWEIEIDEGALADYLDYYAETH